MAMLEDYSNLDYHNPLLMLFSEWRIVLVIR